MRKPRANTNNHNGNDKAPEVDYFSMAKGEAVISRKAGSLQTVLHHHLVAGINDRKDCFRKHCRAAGKSGSSANLVIATIRLPIRAAMMTFLD